MRAVLVTLLVVFFAGVHTASALSGAPGGMPAVQGSKISEAGRTAVMELTMPHHLACCEQTEEQELTAKIAHCSVDCASLQPGSLHIPCPAEATLELSPHPELTALAPVPFIQPPISA
ncbi:hypothetical protein [Roseibium sp. Sym1]|uniref:hypothetical protein n=1 Tax=Roseibium sp. Sym1 TaxID=3016006 RepID=UPI0022B56547|nr:hypothetical protein [Roseibium sp. Sym1]